MFVDSISEKFSKFPNFIESDHSDDHPDHLLEHKNQLRHVKRIIARWLPSSSEFALWVSDMSQLQIVVDRLQKAYLRLMKLMEYQAIFSIQPPVVEVCDRVSELHLSAIEFDRFLRSQVVVE